MVQVKHNEVAIGAGCHAGTGWRESASFLACPAVLESEGSGIKGRRQHNIIEGEVDLPQVEVNREVDQCWTSLVGNVGGGWCENLWLYTKIGSVSKSHTAE